MDDYNAFQRRYRQSLLDEEREELSKHAPEIEAFKKFMSLNGIQLSDNAFEYHQTIGITANWPNIVSYLVPDIKPDKENLFKFDELCQSFGRRGYLNGYLYGSNFILMATPLFRRSFHSVNNYAPSFLDIFWNLNDPTIEKFISLDLNRVRINVDNSAWMERDTWYGAKFNRGIEDIPDGLVKIRPPAYIENHQIEFFFGDAYSLDVKWDTKNGIKTFQAEEFKTESVKITKNDKVFYPARYIHAEFDLIRKCFRHFDGAIHFYAEDEYYVRRDSDFNYNSKGTSQIKTLSQKLFKMNGIVPVDTFVEFSSQFLTGNPLAFEYFEGQYPEHIIEILDKIQKIKPQ